MARDKERHRAWYQANKEKHQASTRKHYARVRQEVLAVYGTQCQECGSTEKINIDHVGQDGKTHVTASGRRIKGAELMRYIIHNDFPDSFRALCSLCNTTAWHLHRLGFDVSKPGFIARARALLCR